MRYKIFTFILCALVMASCAKQKVSIGREDPGMEIEKCNDLFKKKDFEEAVQCLEIFKSRFAGSPFANEAELKIGDAYYNKHEYLMAAESYQAFLHLNPTHSKSDYAHYRVGAAYLAESPKAIDRDQEYLADAAQELEFAVRHYPDSPYFKLAAKDLHEARRRIAHRHFYVGRFYFRTGEYIACLNRLNEVAQNYPQSSFADRSLYMMTIANLKLKRIDDAKKTFSKLALDYPSSKWTKKTERKMKRAAKGN